MQFLPKNMLSKLYFLFSVFFFLNALVSASPISGSNELSNADTLPETLLDARADKPKITTFPTNEEIKKKIKPVAKDKSLFYSALGNNAEAMTWLSDHGHMQIYDFYPPMEYYWDNAADHGAANFKDFVDRASELFAEHAEGEVYAVLGEVNGCSTWTRKEFPALKKNKKVTKVYQVNPKDPNNSNKKEIWPNDESKKTGHAAGEHAKRWPWSKKCLDWDPKKGPFHRKKH
ncbi:hypothetical protein BDV23DRAFT_188923 [Aspergillus alliaceus]|uniref:Uncharacterized protein n=1 Tax=Petromyces alliaceus TaxID=209559 RepID=A0A5N7BSE1_PETAA|nr:hypothetical protein BDV23DRAFT_188923 [Aspergillus alliaceus]